MTTEIAKSSVDFTFDAVLKYLDILVQKRFLHEISNVVTYKKDLRYFL